jgi:hypothetical protein
MQRLLKATLTVAVLVLTAATAFAQEGQIAGTVRDSSGAVSTVSPACASARTQ